MAELQADAVIIGAGIVGMFAARRLAQQGHKVIVLDRDRPGSQASGRNGGGLRQQNRHWAERPLALKARALWAGLEQDWGCDLEYHRGGNIRLLATEKEWVEAQNRIELEAAEGLEVQLLTADQTRALVPLLNPGLELRGSTHCPTDATANPLKTMRHLRRALAGLGVEVRGGEEVTGLVVEKGRLNRVVTALGSYRAPVYLISAGPWTPGLLAPLGLNIPIQARKSKLLITEPVWPVLDAFITFEGGYLRQAADGNFHLGIPSDPAGAGNTRIEAADFAKAAGLFLDRFPFLRKLSIIRGFAGTTAWPPDAFPIMDRAPGLENLFLASGFSGHGYFIGPVAGELMADWLMSGQIPELLKPFNLARFEQGGGADPNAW